MTRVVFRNGVLAGLVAVARARSPYEVGGLIAADSDGAIVEIQPFDKAQESKRKVRLRADDIERATAALATRGLRVVGTFHSHPAGDARPSDADLASLAHGELMVIVGLRGGAAEVRIWAHHEAHGSVEEVRWIETAAGAPG